MNLAQFSKLKLSGRTRDALKLVLVDGKSGYAAARQIGLDPAAVSRALKRVLGPHCPTCTCGRHK